MIYLEDLLKIVFRLIPINFLRSTYDVLGACGKLKNMTTMDWTHSVNFFAVLR
jgi:hypothetical protein